MPNFKALFQAEIEGLLSVGPKEDKAWGLKVQCAKCHEKSDKFIYVDPSEEAETTGGGSAHFCTNCKFCKNQIAISVVAKTFGSYGGGAPAAIVTFDFRGAEPTEMEMDDDWIAIAVESETKFDEEVDLTDEWVDYDEKGSQSVGIKDPQVTFQRAK